MGRVGIKDKYIRLGQIMKLANWVGSGLEAKLVIRKGLVTVNGEVVYERGKKIRVGDVVRYNGDSVEVLQC